MWADILAQEVSRANVGHVYSTSLVYSQSVARTTRQRILYDRLSVSQYMARLTPDVDDLMSFMQYRRMILHGIKATEFFVPALEDDSAPWEFSICGDGNTLQQCIDFFRAMHGRYILTGRTFDVQDYFWHPRLRITDGATIQLYHPLRCRTSRIRLSLVSGSNPLRVLSIYDLSILKCAITAGGALSAHHDRTKDNVSIVWSCTTLERYSEMCEVLADRDPDQSPELWEDSLDFINDDRFPWFDRRQDEVQSALSSAPVQTDPHDAHVQRRAQEFLDAIHRKRNRLQWFKDRGIVLTAREHSHREVGENDPRELLVDRDGLFVHSNEFEFAAFVEQLTDERWDP